MGLMVEQTMAGQAWVARPEHALSARQASWLLVAAATGCGGIALAFAAAGAWLVLPFAGAEIGALWLALRHLHCHAGDEERIEIDDASVRIVHREGGHCTQHEFPRYWARLHVEKPPDREGSRLFLRSHGREIEVGRLMTEQQKRLLAGDLRSRLGN